VPRAAAQHDLQESLTLERLYELLSYDPETGVFRWRVDRYSCKCAGQIAGTTKNPRGYRYISVDCRAYRASRLAWFYVHGVWPPAQVDHVDVHGPHDDDRIVNLRLAGNSQNTANRRKFLKSASPYKGVMFKKKKGCWIARVQADGVRYERSGFKTAEDAFAARNSMATVYHGEFARAE
jgi:hypothetical protein